MDVNDLQALRAVGKLMEATGWHGSILADAQFAALAANFAAHASEPSGARWLPEQGALAVLIADWWLRQNAGPLLGVSGAQGSGKSTFVAHLAAALALRGQNVAVIGLDDLYLSGAARAQLAARVHPLFATRGVPGTHDIPLGMRVLDALAGTGLVALPRFDKALGEPVPEAAWPRVQARCDTVILEGWCVGLPPQADADLVTPCNTLESMEDADGTWRAYVNTQLAYDYQALFSRCDRLLAFLSPDFAAVARWRGWQERALPLDRQMTAAQLRRFIAHYQRLTMHGLAVLPSRADVVVQLDDAHGIGNIRIQNGRR